MGDPDREKQRNHWLLEVLGEGGEISPLAGDASFRCYFRVNHAGRSYVLMDAPPSQENVQPFLDVRNWFEKTGIRVSSLFAKELNKGFLLLEDFGDRTWAGYCEEEGEITPLFEDALRQLSLLQASTPELTLPHFDLERMQRECDLYLDWYLPDVAKVSIRQEQRLHFHASMLESLQLLSGLPQVPVHLDYHSRNLMLPKDGLPLAVIDYQDAVMGPVTYDLASLLYDCYQDYPEALRLEWSRYFFEALPLDISGRFGGFDDWHRKLRLTALQRHIKAIGIFSRLAFRDGKQQFLDEIPLTRKHLADEMLALGMSCEDFPLLFVEPASVAH